MVVPSDDLESVEEVIRAALTSTSPRLIAALAPVIVRHVDRINFRRLRADLAAMGFEHRLDWLFENTRVALEEQIHGSLAPALSKRYRRALLVLETALDFVPPHLRLAAASSDPEVHPPDVLDGGIRSKQSLNEARGASSSISKRFGIDTVTNAGQVGRKGATRRCFFARFAIRESNATLSLHAHGPPPQATGHRRRAEACRTGQRGVDAA